MALSRLPAYQPVSPAVVPLLLLALLGPVALGTARPLSGDMPDRIERVLQQLRPLSAGSVLGLFWRNTRPEIDFVSVNPLEAISSSTLITQTAIGPAMAPGPVPGPGACPPVASECDFFFEGFQDAVPSFNFSSAPPDSPVSPPVVTSVQSSIMTVGAINTGDADYVCSANPPPSDNQFYISGTKLQARSVDGNSAAFIKNQYVKLPFTSAQLSAYGIAMNLNQGQADAQFPEDRRCVVFLVA